MNTPLAERMRPKTLDEYAGQKQLIAPGKPLRRAIEQGLLPSMIFWVHPVWVKPRLPILFPICLNDPFIPLVR